MPIRKENIKTNALPIIISVLALCRNPAGALVDSKSYDEIREEMLSDVKEAIGASYSEEEHGLIQAINAYNELSKSSNLLNERMSEWFGIYFPEVRIASQKSIAEVALLLCKPEGATEEEILAIIPDKDKASSIYRKVGSTMGRHANPEEKTALSAFAASGLDLMNSLEGLEGYINAAAKRIMPNLTYLTEGKISAELLSKAGSMEKMSMMPASTIQLLGAEKALFKHIKFGSRPPKYGVLFKLPVINNARKDLRGKIARAYAAKMCIAVKADHITKNFIADKLKEKLDITVEEINKKPPSQRENRGYGKDGFPQRQRFNPQVRGGVKPRRKFNQGGKRWGPRQNR